MGKRNGASTGKVRACMCFRAARCAMMLCYADVDESRVDLAAACLAGAESAGGLESSDNWAFVLHALFSLFLSFPAMMMMMIMMMLMIVMMMIIMSMMDGVG